MGWGRLIKEALDLNLAPEDALWAVLRAAYLIEQQGEPDPGDENAAIVREARLTPRERETLEVYARCGSFDTAASLLEVRRSTVLMNLRQARRKLRVHTSRRAVSEARRLGLIEQAAAA